jgi:hypothetical protein
MIRAKETKMISVKETKKTTQILIVEDEGIVAAEIKQKLTKMGYHVPAIASSGKKAIDETERVNPDLILMDICLKGDMDGIEATKEIKRFYDVPIIYLTGNADKTTIDRAKQTHPHGYLVKPFKERELQAIIEMALHRHSLERKVKEREQWLSTTLNSIADAVITTNEQGNITYLNPAAEKLTGWSNAEAVGLELKDIFNIVKEETRDIIANPIERALKEGCVVWLEGNIILFSKDGEEIFIEDSAAPIIDEKGNVTGGVLAFRNVTSRKQLEAQLQQAQKLEAIGRLAGGIAHDFNNLLTVVIGHSELMMLNLSPEDSEYRSVEIIKTASERAAKLTRQLLAYSRKQMMQPKVLDLNNIVAEMTGMLQRLIGEDIELITALEPQLEKVKADPSQIEQVLMNLVVNARDAMPNGGKLTIETASVTLDDIYAKQRAEIPGEYIVLSINDTGIGIPQEIQSQIFDPFFTTKGIGKGTGLGLASVYGIVKQSGGHITLQSEVGLGTTFKIYLPEFEQDIESE